MTSPRKRPAADSRRQAGKNTATAKTAKRTAPARRQTGAAEEVRQHLQTLDELTRQARALVEDLRAAQQRSLAASERLDGQLAEVGRLSREAENARRTWASFSGELTDLLGEVRRLKGRTDEETR